MICVNVERPAEWLAVFGFVALRGEAVLRVPTMRKGLKGEMAQLIKAPFIICFCLLSVPSSFAINMLRKWDDRSCIQT